MSSHLSPAKLPGLLKLVVLALVAMTLGALPMAASAQDASSSAAADAAASAAPPAPPAIDPKAVVATVGSDQIVEADLGFEAQQMGSDQLQQVPQDQLRAVLLAQVIATKLISQAAKVQGLDQKDEYKLFLPYLADEVLRQSFENAIQASITPDQIKAEYDKQIAAMPTQDEIHAEHILLDKNDLAKAQDLKKQLDAGADFATLAKANSIEPGAAQSGGDLGYFTADKMVPEFAAAAFALKVGQVSDPVQTQFGWHIIKVLDRRPAAKPTMDQLAPDITKNLAQAKFQSLFQQYLKGATIDIPDASLKAQTLAQLSPQTAPAPDAGASAPADASAPASSSAQ